MSNFDNLRQHASEAREALGKVAPPLPGDSGNAYATLYYPLLFLTQTTEDTLRTVLQRAYDDVRPEMEAAARWLAKAEAAASRSGPPSGQEEG